MYSKHVQINIESQIDSIHLILNPTELNLHEVGHGQENESESNLYGGIQSLFRVQLPITYMRDDSGFSPGYKLQSLGSHKIVFQSQWELPILALDCCSQINDSLIVVVLRVCKSYKQCLTIQFVTEQSRCYLAKFYAMWPSEFAVLE